MWMLCIARLGCGGQPRQGLGNEERDDNENGVDECGGVGGDLGAPGFGGARRSAIHHHELETLPGGYATYAYGINNSGQVVGYAATQTAYSAFLYSNGSMTDLGILPSESGIHPGQSGCYAYGINDAGQIVGSSTTYDSYEVTTQHAFLYSNGSMTSLGTLPGWSVGSLANAINESGQVVGWSYKYSPGTGYDPQPHAFLYSNGSMTDLGTLGGELSYAYALNNSGQVVDMLPYPMATSTPSCTAAA